MTERDDDDKPFDEDAYFAKMGLTKAERKDKWAALRKRHKEGAIPHDGLSILDVRSAQDWMQQTEDSGPEMLFGDFWLKGELAILFADTAKGKSILAVQIAESIARGRPVKPFEMTAKGKVLYLDFELSDAQFRLRYSGVAAKDGSRIRNRRFHPDFVRCQIRHEAVPPAFRDVGEYLAHSIRVEVEREEAVALIIDNISWLRTSNTNASAALALMRELKALKTTHGVSILVLAHTPKRPFARPLTVNDLAGSKMLANFADSIFAIGDSIHGPDIRYLKQIKPRSTPLVYGEWNVAVARIEKPSNFLKFTFTGFAAEADHLIRPHYHLNNVVRSQSEQQLLDSAANLSPLTVDHSEYIHRSELRLTLISEVRRLHTTGLPQRAIADQLGIGVSTVRRYLSEPPS